MYFLLLFVCYPIDAINKERARVMIISLQQINHKFTENGLALVSRVSRNEKIFAHSPHPYMSYIDYCIALILRRLLRHSSVTMIGKFVKIVRMVFTEVPVVFNEFIVCYKIDAKS